MNYVRIIVLTSLFFTSSCSTNTSTDQTKSIPETAKGKAFHKFLQKFRVLALPMEIRSTADFSPEIFPATDPNSTDTLFINNPDTPNRCFGILPDTATVYRVVWLAPAEIYRVMLSTFTKSGEKISERQLAIGACGDDCGFSCTETLLIRKDYTIYSADSIVSGECNDDGKVIPGTTHRYVKAITGKVLNNGKIELSGITTISSTQGKN
ncbi:hypothetical protein G8759_08930 [Spirosoma aureum]|uniref:Lipoprotein n=1 Tax=Spirosoma aureum TaxID=2692134 RepID=A0A6G9AK94_9BACT|nr:hypothetical protein [Spirosoma aureum]QIP12739.1 hypothetical protein G8759_08930 [Spirosoma aureum]